MRHPTPQNFSLTKAGAPGVNGANSKLIRRWVDIIDNSAHGGWSSFTGLLDWFCWAFGIAKEPPQFEDKLNEELYRTVNISPLLVAPSDCFGEWLAEPRGSWNPSGFYPTPHEICEMMCKMTFGTGDMRCKTVNDPCVGSGRFLLHASNYSLRLSGMDMDQTVLKICLINAVLYAPWIARPFPETFFNKEKPSGPSSQRSQEI